MTATVLAVLGTLAGAALTGWMQLRSAAGARRAAAAAETTTARRAAVVDLLAAVEDHRRAMWVREEARLAGAPADRVQQLRAASHETRSAVTRPHASVILLAPDLQGAADALVSSAYALRDAATADELSAARAASVAARQAYISAAAATAR
ncbi:protein kilB [Streptomyces sp. NPDC088910]|uniref:protein kilB n=1 Tax=unclassified Streptomyces TaxID=2593676 RepID=UPI00382E6C4F